MNGVFLIGKIITDINFKFIINSKNISIAMFNIETMDNQIINVKAYNENADYTYSKLRVNDFIIIYRTFRNRRDSKCYRYSKNGLSIKVNSCFNFGGI